MKALSSPDLSPLFSVTVFSSRPCVTLFIIKSLAVSFSFFFVVFFNGSYHTFTISSVLPFDSPPSFSAAHAVSPCPVPWLGSCDVCRLPCSLPICRSSCILVSDPHPLTAGAHLVADASLTHVPVLGVCNDHGKTYALYAITVFRKNPDGSEDCWKTYRRYSDFHDFHMRITEQVKT